MKFTRDQFLLELTNRMGRLATEADAIRADMTNQAEGQEPNALAEVQSQILVREEQLAAYGWCLTIIEAGFEDEQLGAPPPMTGHELAYAAHGLPTPTHPPADPMVGILRNEVSALQGQVNQLIRDLQPLRALLGGR